MCLNDFVRVARGPDAKNEQDSMGERWFKGVPLT